MDPDFPGLLALINASAALLTVLKLGTVSLCFQTPFGYTFTLVFLHAPVWKCLPTMDYKVYICTNQFITEEQQLNITPITSI